jgi:hypothetical protein
MKVNCCLLDTTGVRASAIIEQSVFLRLGAAQENRCRPTDRCNERKQTDADRGAQTCSAEHEQHTGVANL